jgi:hypothetical protein
MYYYTAVVRLQPEALKRLTSEAPTLLGYIRDRVYMGRTIDPHRRSTSWKSEDSHSLGKSLHRLANLGYVCYKDYIPMCRVWFCLVGAKNTTKNTWDAPETAFKMMVARTPNKLHSQSIEYCRKFKGYDGHRMSSVLAMHNSAKLEAEAERILANVFDVDYVRNYTNAQLKLHRLLNNGSTTKPLHGPFLKF